MHLGAGSANRQQQKKSMFKSAYEQLEEIDLREIIDEKQLTIRRLQFKIEKLQKQNQELRNDHTSQRGASDNVIMDKLEREIKEHGEASDALLQISHKLRKIIKILEENNGFQEESTEVKHLLNIIGGSESQYLSVENSSVLSDDSEIEDNDTIRQQAIRITNDLQIICGNFQRNYLKMQRQVLSIDKKYKNEKSIFGEEKQILQKQLKQIRNAKDKLRVLLEKNQKQKNQLVNQIKSLITSQYSKALQTMSRNQLIDEIKKLMFKNKELERSRVEIHMNNQKHQEKQRQKLKKLLMEVKEVQEQSRMNMTSY